MEQWAEQSNCSALSTTPDKASKKRRLEKVVSLQKFQAYVVIILLMFELQTIELDGRLSAVTR